MKFLWMANKSCMFDLTYPEPLDTFKVLDTAVDTVRATFAKKEMAKAAMKNRVRKYARILKKCSDGMQLGLIESNSNGYNNVYDILGRTLIIEGIEPDFQLKDGSE
ncbi:hypothetical protein GF406_05625 [candidate division KSB1 bacterium]|nr:hypothetical protein [candidate division KSB1 bacterium]